MRRLLIALVILGLLAGGNLYSRSLLRQGGRALLQQVEELEQAVDGPARKTERLCQNFCLSWLQTEKRWSRFLPSDRLEQITVTAARLPVYARYGSRAEVLAGLCEIRVLLEEVLAFELPAFSDLF